MSPLASVRLPAAVSLFLALGCAALAWRYEQARQAAICWRAVAEEGVAAEGRCPSPS